MEFLLLSQQTLKDRKHLGPESVLAVETASLRQVTNAQTLYATEDAFGGCFQAGHDAEQSGLALAVGAHQGHFVAVGQLERDASKDVLRAV